MSHRVTKWAGLVSIVAAIGMASSLVALSPAPASALKARKVAPKAAEIDKTATLDLLLTQPNVSDWSPKKGASLEGYVIQVVRSEDGDMRLSLTAKPDETDTRKWVIVEVTPEWMKKAPGLSAAKVWRLSGKKVRATGWLYFDKPEVTFPRGTNWELHPVTEIVPIP